MPGMWPTCVRPWDWEHRLRVHMSESSCANEDSRSDDGETEGHWNG